MRRRSLHPSRRPLVALGAATCVALSAALPLGLVHADPPTPSNPAGQMLGVVPVHALASNSASAGGNLIYHNGPTMHTNTTYAIYWVPAGYSVSSRYESLINGFFANVAGASGAQSNVYYSDTQYYDTMSGSVRHILYSSKAGGYAVDTIPFPANGCSDPYTKVCLTDSQLRSEINRVIGAKGWTRGPSSVFFMFTPRNVGSCFGGSCAFTQFCAYHSWSGSGATVTLYANMPYAAYVPSACGSGQSPNGDAADSTINVTSHEHNEAITDEQGSAWYDRRGFENGDKCAWNFGSLLGHTAYGAYNQAIGAGKYYLQQEWSNRSSGCVLRGT